MATIYRPIAAGGFWSAAGSWVIWNGSSWNSSAASAAPTVVDDVVIDNTLTGTLTVNGTSGSPNLCRSLDCSGTVTATHGTGNPANGTLAFAASSYLNIGDTGGTQGDIRFHPTLNITNAGSGATRGRIQLASAYGTSNGNLLHFYGASPPMRIFVTGSGKWTMQDGFTLASGYDLQFPGGGNFQSAGYFMDLSAIKCAASSATTINLSNSTVVIRGGGGGAFDASGSGLTLTPPAKIIFSGNSSPVTGDGNTNQSFLTGGNTYQSIVVNGTEGLQLTPATGASLTAIVFQPAAAATLQFLGVSSTAVNLGTVLMLADAGTVLTTTLLTGATYTVLGSFTMVGDSSTNKAVLNTDSGTATLTAATGVPINVFNTSITHVNCTTTGGHTTYYANSSTINSGTGWTSQTLRYTTTNRPLGGIADMGGIPSMIPATYSSVTAYAQWSLVSYSGNVYASIIEAPAGNIANPTYWVNLGAIGTADYFSAIGIWVLVINWSDMETSKGVYIDPPTYTYFEAGGATPTGLTLSQHVALAGANGKQVKIRMMSGSYVPTYIQNLPYADLLTGGNNQNSGNLPIPHASGSIGPWWQALNYNAGSPTNDGGYGWYYYQAVLHLASLYDNNFTVCEFASTCGMSSTFAEPMLKEYNSAVTLPTYAAGTYTKGQYVNYTPFNSGADTTTFSATAVKDTTNPTWVNNAYVGLTVTAGGVTGLVTANNTTGLVTLSGGWSGSTPSANTAFTLSGDYQCTTANSDGSFVAAHWTLQTGLSPHPNLYYEWQAGMQFAPVLGATGGHFTDDSHTYDLGFGQQGVAAYTDSANVQNGDYLAVINGLLGCFLAWPNTNISVATEPWNLATSNTTFVSQDNSSTLTLLTYLRRNYLNQFVVGQNSFNNPRLAGYAQLYNWMSNNPPTYIQSQVASSLSATSTPTGTGGGLAGLAGNASVTAIAGFTPPFMLNDAFTGINCLYFELHPGQYQDSTSYERATWVGGAQGYTQGVNYVSHSGNDYLCIVSNSDAAFTAAHWSSAVASVGLGYATPTALNIYKTAYGATPFINVTTATASETFSFSETSTRTVVNTRSISEGAALTETNPTRLVHNTRSITEGAALGDVNPTRLVTYSRAITGQDSFTFTETPSRIAVNIRAITGLDSFTFSETPSRIAVNIRAVTGLDSFSFSETTASSKSLTRNITDSLSFSETPSRIVVNTRVISEGAALSESAIRRTVANLRAITGQDSFTFSETILRPLVLSRSTSEGAALSDTGSRIIVNTRAITGQDSFSFSDTPSRGVSTFGRAITDSFSFSETPSRLIVNSRSITGQDSFTLSETTNRIVVNLRAITGQDSFAFSETVHSAGGVIANATDTFTFSETPSRLVVNIRAITDSFSFSETISRVVANLRSITDSFSFSELSASDNPIIIRAVNDSFTFSESIVAGKIAARSVSDSFTFSELALRSVVNIRSIIEGTTLTETVTVDFTSGGGGTRHTIDTFTFSDSGYRSATLFRGASDSFSFSENITTFTSGLHLFLLLTILQSNVISVGTNLALPVLAPPSPVFTPLDRSMPKPE
jgi:hypothetical protein